MVDLKGGEKFFADLRSTWPVIAGCAGISLFISYIHCLTNRLVLTFLIKWTTKCIVWMMIIGYLILVAGIGTIAFFQAEGY
jgi:hypothetical protein